MRDRKAKILIVDDDPLIRTSLSQIFTGFGYSVRSAEDGFSALMEMKIEIPDIILSDLNMPRMSGFELLSAVRCQFPTIPVIAMSAAFSGGGVPAGVTADGFYDKTTNLGSLLQLVDTMQSVSRRDRQAPPAA